MRARTGKRRHQMAVRTTISMPPQIFDIAQESARTRAFSSFSDYIQALIRADRAMAGTSNQNV